MSQTRKRPREHANVQWLNDCGVMRLSSAQSQLLLNFLNSPGIYLKIVTLGWSKAARNITPQLLQQYPCGDKIEIGDDVTRIQKQQFGMDGIALQVKALQQERFKKFDGLGRSRNLRQQIAMIKHN